MYEFIHIILHGIIVGMSAYIVYHVVLGYRKFKDSILGIVWKIATPIALLAIVITVLLSPPLIALTPMESLHIIESGSLLLILIVTVVVLERFSRVWRESMLTLSKSATEFNVPVLLATLRNIFGEEGYTVAYYMGFWLVKSLRGLNNVYKVAERASELIGIPNNVVVREGEILVSITTKLTDKYALESLKWYLKGYWEGALRELYRKELKCNINVEEEEKTPIITLSFKIPES